MNPGPMGRNDGSCLKEIKYEYIFKYKLYAYDYINSHCDKQARNLCNALASDRGIRSAAALLWLLLTSKR